MWFSVLFLKYLCIMFLVQVAVKDIPLRVDALNAEQKSLKKSLSSLTTQGDGDVPQLRAAVSALKSQVLYIYAFTAVFVPV